MKYRLLRNPYTEGKREFIKKKVGKEYLYYVQASNRENYWVSKQWILDNRNDIINVKVSGTTIRHQKLLLKVANAALNENVQGWFLDSYPDDECGQYINPNITFKHILKALNAGKDIYEVIGFGDSLIRELIFNRLSVILNVTYDRIYEMWLENSES